MPLTLVVATYKEGEAEAGYWENPSVDTHKVVCVMSLSNAGF